MPGEARFRVGEHGMGQCPMRMPPWPSFRTRCSISDRFPDRCFQKAARRVGLVTLCKFYTK